MTLRTRIRRLAPFVALGLVVPLIWSLVVVGLPDDRLATVEGKLVVEGLPAGEVRRFSAQEPVLNVTIRAVLDAPGGSQLSPGDRIEVLVPTYGVGADTVLSADRALLLALVPAEKQGPDEGSDPWQGWSLADAKAGQLWALQAEALTGALVAAIPSVAGALLTGYALGLPHDPRRPIVEGDGPAAIGGLFLGLFLGAVMAAVGTGTNLLLPRSADGIPLPGSIGAALIAMAGVGAIWPRPRVLPNGGRTATVGGLALLTAFPAALALAWDGQLGTGHLLLEELQMTAAVGGVAVLAVAGARWLRIRWARLASGLLLLAPSVYVLVTSPVLLAVALPVGIAGLAGARDLVGPALVASRG